MDSWNDVAIIAVLVILVIIAPLCTIWAINTLFGLGIAYTGKTWLAALVLTTILSSASRKRKG